LDSSSVAGMLKRAQDDAATFTIGFDAAGYDESGFARIAAEHFGTRHHEYFVTPRDVCAALPSIAAHYGEPFGNSSVVPAYYCAKFAHEHGVGLMLAGDGGDELFAGNTRYTDQNVFEAWFRLPGALRAAVKGGYRLLPGLARLPLAGKGARYIAQAEMGLPDRLQSYNFLNRFAPASVFAGDWLRTIDQAAPWALWRERYAATDAPSALQRMLYLDWKFTLADNDLVKVNNMCELAGIEVAYPMLDERVVELACRVPPRTLLRDGNLRGFYKHATRGFLPAAVIEKSKHGFGLPFGVWVQHDEALRGLTADAFDALARRDIFDAAFLHDVQRLHGEGAAGYYGELVWILTMLELWFVAHDV
ncbi:MAG: asparagine synthase C-terminal domain-containing protein, partial [Gammaproteobacteria bacterium]